MRISGIASGASPAARTVPKVGEASIRSLADSSVRHNELVEQAVARYRHLSLHDPLTGIPNRAAFIEHLNRRPRHISLGAHTALLSIDLDRFKQVNDTYGHPVGDELLKQVAARITKIVGNRGEVGRPGGDEFNIILPDVDDRGVLGDGDAERQGDGERRWRHAFGCDGRRHFHRGRGGAG